MADAPKPLIPPLGRLYAIFAPITEPLIRLIAGGSLAFHGYQILFGNIEGAGRFFEKRRLRERPALGLDRRHPRTRLRALPCARPVHAARRRADHRFSHRRDRHLSLGVRLQLGEPRHRVSAVLGDRRVSFSDSRRRAVVARREDRTRNLIAIASRREDRMLNRRTLLLSGAALAAGLAPARAQDYPARPIRIIVPLAAGGMADILARVIAQKITEAGHTARGGEPHRRRGRDRRGRGREVAGGRLHAADGPARHAGDPRAPAEAALRPGEGFRAGDPCGDRAERAAGQQFGAGHLARRADRLRQGQSGQAHLRVAGQRLDRPHDRRAIQGRWPASS